METINLNNSISPTFYEERIMQLSEPFINTIYAVMDIVVTLDDIVKVVLFGSCVRGTQSNNSDIDLLLLLDSERSGVPFAQLEEQVGVSIFEQFDTNYKKPVDFVFADMKSFLNNTNPYSVYSSAKREGVIIYE